MSDGTLGLSPGWGNPQEATFWGHMCRNCSEYIAPGTVFETLPRIPGIRQPWNRHIPPCPPKPTAEERIWQVEQARAAYARGWQPPQDEVKTNG